MRGRTLITIFDFCSILPEEAEITCKTGGKNFLMK
jgi:hypothetical protein